MNSIYALQEEYPNLYQMQEAEVYIAHSIFLQEKKDKLSELLLEEGSILLGSGHQSIRFRPHLNVKRELVDFLEWTALKKL